MASENNDPVRPNWLLLCRILQSLLTTKTSQMLYCWTSLRPLIKSRTLGWWANFIIMEFGETYTAGLPADTNSNPWEWKIWLSSSSIRSLLKECLCPTLFLLYINDLPQYIKNGSSVRLFADDCILYRRIKTPKDEVFSPRVGKRLAHGVPPPEMPST